MSTYICICIYVKKIYNTKVTYDTWPRARPPKRRRRWRSGPLTLFSLDAYLLHIARRRHALARTNTHAYVSNNIPRARACECKCARRRTLVTARDGGRPQQTFTPGSERARGGGGNDDGDVDDDSGQCRVVSPGSAARRQSPRHGAHPDPPPRAAAASVHDRPSRSAAVSCVAHSQNIRRTLQRRFFLLATMTFTGVLRVSLFNPFCTYCCEGLLLLYLQPPALSFCFMYFHFVYFAANRMHRPRPPVRPFFRFFRFLFFVYCAQHFCLFSTHL